MNLYRVTIAKSQSIKDRKEVFVLAESMTEALTKWLDSVGGNLPEEQSFSIDKYMPSERILD